MRVKLVNENAKAPYRANPKDAGADLFATESVIIPAHGNYFMDLGVIIELPKDTVGLITARSSLGSKFGIRPRNCLGVIDEKYRNTLGIMIENSSIVPYTVRKGDKIAQLLVIPVQYVTIEVVDELDMDEDRGGGWGHTGK